MTDNTNDHAPPHRPLSAERRTAPIPTRWNVLAYLATVVALALVGCNKPTQTVVWDQDGEQIVISSTRFTTLLEDAVDTTVFRRGPRGKEVLFKNSSDLSSYEEPRVAKIGRSLVLSYSALVCAAPPGKKFVCSDLFLDNFFYPDYRCGGYGPGIARCRNGIEYPDPTLLHVYRWAATEGSTGAAIALSKLGDPQGVEILDEMSRRVHRASADYLWLQAFSRQEDVDWERVVHEGSRADILLVARACVPQAVGAIHAAIARFSSRPQWQDNVRTALSRCPP